MNTFAISTTAPGGVRGFVMIVSLLFLVVLTVLSISMFRSFGLQERIAGNTREKERAFEAAQSALRYGEWWLDQGNGGTGSTCSGLMSATDPTQMQVCSNALANPALPPWATRADYAPPLMALAATGSSGGLTGSGKDINYYAKPGLYVSYLGLDPLGKSQLYQVTAFGYGGSATAVAVVQSTYKLASCVKDLGSLDQQGC